MNKKQVEKYWKDIATKQLVGRTIKAVRYMTVAEQEDLGWHSRPLLIQLSDGNVIYPSRDDEGNDAGVFYTTDKENNLIPAI